MVHRNSWFTDKKWWFSIVMSMFTREYPRVPFLHQVLTNGFQPILIYPLKRHFIFLSSSPSKSIDRRVSLTNLASASLQWRTHFEKCWGIGQESISLTFGTSFPRVYQSMIGCVGGNTFESMEITGLEHAWTRTHIMLLLELGPLYVTCWVKFEIIMFSCQDAKWMQHGFPSFPQKSGKNRMNTTVQSCFSCVCFMHFWHQNGTIKTPKSTVAPLGYPNDSGLVYVKSVRPGNFRGCEECMAIMWLKQCHNMYVWPQK